MEVKRLNSNNFQEEVIQESKVVLVDFYADWCGPCKMMSPIVDDIANELDGVAKVCKLNVDESQDLAIQYNVMSIPTLIIFKNGKAVETLVGLREKGEILNILKSIQ